MKITIEGNLEQTGSYGIVNLFLAKALAKRGHEINLAGVDILPDRLKKLVQGENNISVRESITPQDVRIRQIWPPIWTRVHPKETLIVIQPWEFGSIPVEWLQGIQNVDAIWVPTEYCKRGYIQAGVDIDKVWVVPNGIENNINQTILSNKDKSGDLIELLFVGGSIYRKGIDVAIHALNLLSDKNLERVHLTVKEVGGNSFYKGQSTLAEALEKCPRVSASLTVIDNYISRTELLGLIANADYLLHPYRGEGFSMPVLEAMACGTPVIHTKGGATNEFCPENISITIPSSLTVGDKPMVGNMLLADKSYWMEPSVEEVSAILERILSGERISPEAIAKMKLTAEQYTWDQVAIVAERSIEGCINGTKPSDSLSELEWEIKDLLRGHPDNVARAISQLTKIWDFATAKGLMEEYIKSSTNPGRTLHETYAKLDSIERNTPDVWSGGIYRQLVRERNLALRLNDELQYVHTFEGDQNVTFQIAQHLSKYLSGCTSVLDIGCGQGSMLRALRNAGKKTQGIEADPTLVRKLHNDGFEIFEGYVPQYLDDFQPKSFDGVFLGHIAEHMSCSEFTKILRWVSTNIEEGGLVLIQTPDFSNPFVSSENFWLDPTHIRPYPIKLLKTLLADCGFMPIEGGCRKINEIAPLDIIALGRKVSNRAKQLHRQVKTKPKAVIAHYSLVYDESGFARASQTLLDHSRLLADGYEVIGVALDQPSQDVDEKSLQYNPGTNPEADIAIIDAPIGWLAQISPHVHGKKRIARTTFEAYPLPLGLFNVLSGFDEIWTFSKYDAEIFGNAGIPLQKIKIIPPSVQMQTVDQSMFTNRNVDTDQIKLLSVFNFEPRKNPRALLKAFSLACSRNDSILLTIKTSGIAIGSFIAWMKDVLTDDEFNRIKDKTTVICERLTRQQLENLYMSHDAFVLPTRGEGYGLPFIEAKSFGLAIICPDVGGHMDFCDETNAILVKSHSVPVLFEPGSESFIGCNWRETDPEELGTKLIELAENREYLELMELKAANIDRTQQLTSTNVIQEILESTI